MSRTTLIIRLSIIILLGVATGYILVQTPYWLAAFWTGLFAFVFLLELLYYLERRHRELQNFVSAIEQNDFSASYTHRTSELQHAYTRIMDTFRNLRSEKESQHQLLQTIIDHIGVAIISYDEQEKISLMNKAAQLLFQKPYLHTLQGFSTLDPNLHKLIREISSGEQEMFKWTPKGNLKILSIQATEFKLLGEPQKLVSFQDISREMEAQEVDSWQKLIRVLTHEITNSVIPIATLSEVTRQSLNHPNGSPRPLDSLPAEEAEDLRKSLDTIANRSEGLAHFVKEYKDLTRISPLTLSEFEVKDLFERVYILFRPQLEDLGVSFEIQLPLARSSSTRTWKK